MTIRKGLRWALMAQAGLALFLIAADAESRLRPVFGGGAPLPTGPVTPGDQVRPFDPRQPAPDVTRPSTPPGSVPAGDRPRRMAFSLTDAGGLGQVLLLHGPIAPGDADRFTGFLAGLADPPAHAALSSPGGTVAEALEIGRSLRDAGLNTVVLSGTVCLSACPYVLAGGVERVVSRSASVGMHQSYYDAPGYLPVYFAVEDIQHGQGQTLGYLIDMGVDPSLMLYSLNTPPDEIYVLVEEELVGTGLATGMID